MTSPLTFSYDSCTVKSVSLNPGTYRLEVWGASGGSYIASGGLGGYSRGELTLDSKTNVFVHVGGQGGTYSSPGCNGGGTGSSSSKRSGGGATDIRLITDSLYSRIIVAGGGAGSADGAAEYGGYGGGSSGGNGADNNYAGKGASQNSETTLCADGSTTSCIKGIFGYGANATGGGGAGGGWYGGSASTGGDGSGGGSGYILTKDSFRPQGYLLNESKYYLQNATTLAGNKPFPSPTTSSPETGHNGSGYAIITPLFPAVTPATTPHETAMATLKATMIGILPELRYTFVSDNGDILRDKKGLFRFGVRGVYKADVTPGRYLFYANGTLCGQSIFTQHTIRLTSSMEVVFADDVMISINDNVFLRAPGHGSQYHPFVDPKANTFFNFTMSEYDCDEFQEPALFITYQPFYHVSCKTSASRNFIEFAKIAIFVLST